MVLMRFWLGLVCSLVMCQLLIGCATQSKYVRKKRTSSANQQTHKKRKINAPAPTPLFDWPIGKSVVFYGFDDRPASLHEGISIGAPEGTSVRSVGQGEVIYTGTSNTPLGKMVMVAHSEHWISVYAELGSIKVRKGDKVSSGSPIGTVGKGDQDSSPALFFQLRYDREAVDPVLYLRH